MDDEARHPADASALPNFVSKPPTEARVTGARDVIVVPTTYVEGDYVEQEPAGEDAVQLGERLTLERLSPEEVELVMNACMPRGHYFIAVRQYGQRYTFVQQVGDAMLEERPFGWDEDNLLFYSLVLSRLVRDNGHSLEFAARIVDYDDGMQQVIPVHTTRHVATFRLRQDRDWLTAAEASDLRQLLAAFIPIKDALPWPVIHALNLTEDAVHLQIIQRALLLIVTALEGLLQSSTSGVSRQFRERMPKLAAAVGVDGVDVAFARDLYEARSEAAHGAQVSMFRVQPERDETEEPELPHAEPEPEISEPEPAAKLALAQDVVRAATRKAIQDPEFRAVFESRESIAERWQLDP